MKICFLTPEYPHSNTGPSGGIGTSILSLSRELIHQGNEVCIVVYGQETDEWFDDDGIKVYRLKNVKLKGLSWLLTRFKIQKLINSLHARKLVDIVEAPDWTGITSFIKFNCPLVLKLHGSDTYFCYLDNRKVKPINSFHEKMALKKCNAIIAVSDYVGAVTNKLFSLNKSYTVIPNAIDTASYKISDKVRKNTILYFGTLIRKKGVLELAKIFNEVHRQNPAAKLLLVGNDSADMFTGNLSTWLLMKQLFTKDAADAVTYTGVIPHSEMQSYIDGAAVCVFPSFAEALPVSWLEAMAMGKPVVASNIGWAFEMIEDGKEGYLVFPKDHKHFAERILQILGNEKLAKMLGSNSRSRTVDQFDSNLIARQTVELYKTVIDSI